jgi:hypothetical protein
MSSAPVLVIIGARSLDPRYGKNPSNAATEKWGRLRALEAVQGLPADGVVLSGGQELGGDGYAAEAARSTGRKLVEYSPNAYIWVDGAATRRWSGKFLPPEPGASREVWTLWFHARDRALAAAAARALQDGRDVKALALFRTRPWSGGTEYTCQLLEAGLVPVVRRAFWDEAERGFEGT